MRVKLKKFQRERVIELLGVLADAQSSVRRGRPKAIVLSAPTGSGKTIIAAATMEAAIAGGDLASAAGFEPDGETTFLWLSDDPELNMQSRARIEDVADGIPGRCTEIDTNFDQPTLDPGRVYFLNYSKLTRVGRLGILSDDRATTIWETIARTGRERPGKLVVVMDEAHKGLGRAEREETERKTIASRFLTGGGTATTIRRPDGGGTEPFPPVPLVLGISATAAKFNAVLDADPGRGREFVTVTPAEVRESGLIKDDLVLYGLEETDPPVWTLLSAAIAKVREMEAAWSRLHEDGGGEAPLVVPLLVVQVEDGTAGRLSDTSLDDVVACLARDWTNLRDGQVVHCFGDKAAFRAANGWTVPRMDPSEISAAQGVRVVLFKTALNTGWDCPRAEVLMSFRGVASATDIAQLVGRMVRTPLAERVESDDTLNETHLYLPRFNRERLKAVRDALVTDAGEGISVRVEGEALTLVVREGMEDIHAALQGLPSVSVPSGRATPDLRRVFLLAHLLDQDGLGKGEVERTAKEMVARLEREFADAAASDPAFMAHAGTREPVHLAALAVRDGVIGERDGAPELPISDLDVEKAFAAARGILGHEIAGAWLRRRYDPEQANLVEVKLDFLRIVKRPGVLARMTAHAGLLFARLRDEHWDEVAEEVGDERKGEYAAILGGGRTPQRQFLLVPRAINVPRPTAGAQVDGHLFVIPETAGEFVADLNGWERAILAEEAVGTGYLGFLRNAPRAHWALSYAYDFNGWKPSYPDFLVFRRCEGEIVVDILEPHQGEDSVAKIKGLAHFAAENAASFGRIQMIRETGPGVLRRLSLQEEGVRRRVIEDVRGADDLVRAFEELGTVGP